MVEDREEIKVTSNDRLDKIISVEYEELTRSRVQKLIEDGLVSVNGKIVTKCGFKCAVDDIIEFEIPKPEDVSIVPENIPIDIVYEDDDIIIVNKAKGMVVHPAPGHYSNTLVNALMYHCGNNLSGINGELRPGIVHRIDMDTTGLLVVCKNDKAHNHLSDLLSTHSINRIYYCIVVGNIKEDEGVVDAPIGRHKLDRKKMAIDERGGRRAVTHYKVIYRFSNQYTLVQCKLETGRTHQIRVHMTSLHHPLLGDTIYGSDKQPFKTDGQVLHAAVLGFIHPSTKEYVEFNSKLPEYFAKLCEKLCKDSDEISYMKSELKDYNLF